MHFDLVQTILYHIISDRALIHNDAALPARYSVSLSLYRMLMLGKGRGRVVKYPDPPNQLSLPYEKKKSKKLFVLANGPGLRRPSK